MADPMRDVPGLRRYSIPACVICGARPAPFGYRSAGASRDYCLAHRSNGDAWLAEIKQQRLNRLEAL